MSENPDKQEISRDNKGRFVPGYSGNPKGRPPGKTLKEYWRERFADMSEEEKEEFATRVSPELLWKMAEGQPHITTDITTAGKPIPLLANLDVRTDDSNKENKETEEKD